MTGFGDGTLGSMSFGMEEPDEAAAPPVLGLGARYIDPTTGAYTLDADGEYERQPTTRQRVMLALTTRAASSSVLQSWGIRLPERIDAQFDKRVRAAVNNALASLVNVERRIVINAIDIEQSNHPGRVTIVVSYTDLETQEADKVTRTL